MKIQHRAIEASHARLLLSLDHPNLARTRDLGALPGGGSFVVMDLVEGVALDAVSETAAVVRAAIGVAGALEALHAVGIVHGDVKPSNILVRGDRAVLVDLGTAVAVGRAERGAAREPRLRRAGGPLRGGDAGARPLRAGRLARVALGRRAPAGGRRDGRPRGARLARAHRRSYRRVYSPASRGRCGR